MSMSPRGRPLTSMGPPALVAEPLSSASQKALGLKRCTVCTRLRFVESFYTDRGRLEARCARCAKAFEQSPAGKRRRWRYNRSAKGQRRTARRLQREAAAGPQPAIAEVRELCLAYGNRCGYCGGETTEANRSPGGSTMLSV